MAYFLHAGGPADAALAALLQKGAAPAQSVLTPQALSMLAAGAAGRGAGGAAAQLASSSLPTSSGGFSISTGAGACLPAATCMHACTALYRTAL